jgi:peptide chain release factor 1
MLKKLEYLSQRFSELEILVSDPDLPKDPKRYRETLQEHAHLREIMDEYAAYRKVTSQLGEAETIIREESDHELRELARAEIRELETALEAAERRLKDLLVPKDPLDGKNIIMEIRAGTGGDEAALFASDLFRMYSRYAELRRWKLEIISASPTELGGFKEIVFSLSGSDVYGTLRYESGVHRVQRVPETEAGGRIHTSAVTVAVLPEAEETDIEINPDDLKIDTYLAGGAGGQHVNKTESAVRMTHLPTGIVVTCQDEKSQHKNRAKALRVLRARLYEMEEERKRQERSEARKTQVGSGDRSERIRTYNFPQNRLTDHRINLTLYKLDSVIEGHMDAVIEPLKLIAREEAAKAGSE